jgi:hypothetical protein
VLPRFYDSVCSVEKQSNFSNKKNRESCRHDLIPTNKSGRSWAGKKTQKRPRFALEKALKLLSENFPMYCQYGPNTQRRL